MAVNIQAPTVNGARTIWDTIVSPKEAFEAIRLVPTWALALAIAVVLTAIGDFLTVPAAHHAILTNPVASFGPRYEQMTPGQQQTVLGTAQTLASFAWIRAIFVIPLFCLIEALIMLGVSAVGGGQGGLARFWAVACNVAVVAALGNIINGVVVTIRGAESFTTMASVQNALPSLALLDPGAGTKLAALLAAFNPFAIWVAGLTVCALLVSGRTRTIPAWACGVILFAIPALLAFAFAK